MIKVLGLSRKLNKREKYAVSAAGLVVAAFIVFNLVLNPLMEKQQRLRRSVQAKESMLQELLVLTAQYESIRNRSDSVRQRYTRRQKGFTLFSFLDQLAGQVGVKDRIAYMKPSTSAAKDRPYVISMVEMKLQGVTLQQVSAYLYNVETSENDVFVRRLSISRTGKDDTRIDAVLQVEAFII